MHPPPSSSFPLPPHSLFPHSPQFCLKKHPKLTDRGGESFKHALWSRQQHESLQSWASLTPHFGTNTVLLYWPVLRSRAFFGRLRFRSGSQRKVLASAHYTLRSFLLWTVEKFQIRNVNIYACQLHNTYCHYFWKQQLRLRKTMVRLL